MTSDNDDLLIKAKVLDQTKENSRWYSRKAISMTEPATEEEENK